MTLSAVDRLAHKTWARQLRSSAMTLHKRGLLSARVAPCRDSWTWLASELIWDGKPGTDEDERFQGLFNVAAKGSDPRRVMRRIRVSGNASAIKEGQLAKRRPSGCPEKGQEKGESSVDYRELRIDLASRGDVLVAGASRWIDSPLWGMVAARRQPDLEDLRTLIRWLLSLHGLCRLPPAYYARAKSDCRDSSTHTSELYRQSLAPLVCNLHPDSICLLSALTLESFIVGNYELLELQREGLCTQVSRLLSDPYMADLKEELLLLVVGKLVNMEWEEAPPFAPVSIDCPLTPIPC